MQLNITGRERLGAKVRKMSAGRVLTGGFSSRLVFSPLSLAVLVNAGERR